MAVFVPIVLSTSLTRRHLLRAGAAGTAAAALAPALPAFAKGRPALFELDLAGLDGPGAASAASAGGWRTTGIIPAPRRFDLVGLRWARGSRAEAMVRARRRGGSWTRWAHLPALGDHGPDGPEGGGKPVPGTDPAFVGTADELQLRIKGAPRGLHARFVRALPTATAARRVTARLKRRAGARSAQVVAGGPPPIISRTEWGASSVPPREAPAYGSVQMAFVHHTVTANDYGPEDSAAIVLGITRYHRDGNGWNDVGYNFLVDKYGQVFEGRAGGMDAPVLGAQVAGFNSVSTGVACLGTFTDLEQSPAALEVMARLIGWKLSLHGVPVEGAVAVTPVGGTAATFERISGHRDANATSCPGDALYAQLADLRARAAGHAGPVPGLTVQTASRVRGVRPSDVSGYLRFPDGSSPAGAVLDLEFRRDGRRAWTRIAGVQCGSDGGWRASVVLSASGLVRAVYPGDAVRLRQESLPVRVTIVPRMRIAVDSSEVPLGRSLTVTGTVDPAERVTLILHRRVGRRWVKERKRSLRVRDGAFDVRLRPRERGKYRVTVRKHGLRRRRTVRVS